MYKVRWAKAAVVYLVIGSIMGMVMSASGHFEYHPLHAHIQLVGWASMGLMAVMFHIFPGMEQSKLAKVHWYLYQVIFPLFMLSLATTIMALPIGEATIPFTGAGMVITLILTAVFIWQNAKVTSDTQAGTAKAS